LKAAAFAGSVDATASARTTRPPGVQTRFISARTPRGSGKWWKAKRETTSENEASGNGSGATSPSRHPTFASPFSACSG
jgi:hypothetical protein